MRKNRTYEIVDYTALKGAMSVKNYAAAYNEGKGVTTGYIYHLELAKKIKIVQFEGYNFVLPIEILK